MDFWILEGDSPSFIDHVLRFVRIGGEWEMI